jgi:hypothetical protein
VLYTGSARMTVALVLLGAGAAIAAVAYVLLSLDLCPRCEERIRRGRLECDHCGYRIEEYNAKR